MSKRRARCAAIRVGWGRCDREAGHTGLHRAGDEDAGGWFTTTEGKESEHQAKLRSGELHARVVKRAKAALEEFELFRRGEACSLFPRMDELRDAVEEAEK